jgi:hypothetical protein
MFSDVRIAYIWFINLKHSLMKIFVKSIVIAALSATSFSNVHAQTIDEITKKHIDAVGGIENWNKVKSIRMEGKVKAQGADILITISQIDKKAMRQDIEVMGMKGYYFVTNTEGYSYMPFQGQTKPEPMTADDVKNSQDDLYLHDDFITCKELGKKVELIGKDEIDGTECFKIKMTDKDGQETTYFLDADNYYVIKQVSKVKANGQEMENSSSFGDFKKTPEGVVFPMSLMGGFGDTQITKIEINPTLDDSLFKIKS